ncbi:hypothetical protein KY289_008973 [Solanum tuberosum]|nr:hypothetical protein KY289_008973 [Solanum tuberosum]
MIIVILVLVAIAGTIFYFLYRPQLPSFSISSLKISQFNLTTSPDDTTRLATKFNVTLSTKNKNKKVIYIYDPIALKAESTNQIELANGDFPRFTSAPNNVTIIHSTLSIVSQVLDVDSISSLKSDMKRKSGMPMRILLDTKVVVKMDKLKTNKVGIRVTCDGINGPIPKGKNPSVASITTAKCVCGCWVCFHGVWGGHLVAGDDRSDGFGIVRFMGCAPVWRKKENGWVGGVWSLELLVV